MSRLPDYRAEYCVKADGALCDLSCDDDQGGRTGPHTHVFICPLCDTALATDPSRGEALHPYGQWLNTEYANLTDREICYYCYESENEHQSTLVRFDPDGSYEVVKFGDEIARDSEYGEEPPPWFWEVFTKRDYVPTDAWRGHYDTKLTGLKKITSGWVTGYPDDSVRHKLTASDLYQKMTEGSVTAPVPVYWLFEPTSNVFSMASEILVREADYEAAMEWLGEDFEALDRAFG